MPENWENYVFEILIQKFKLEFQLNMQAIQESRNLRTCDSGVFQL